MAKWKRDTIYGIAILIVSIVGILATQDVQVTGTPLFITRADVYVWLWMAIMGILAIALIVKSLIQKDETVMPAIWSKQGVVTVLASIVYLAIMKLVGFNISTFLYEAGLIIYYSAKMGKLKGDKKHLIKTLALYILIALIATVATKLLFTKVLSVRLPKGQLF